MKRILLGGGLLAILLAGAASGYYLYRTHQQRNVHGSSTVEFVSTQQEQVRPPAELTEVPWPQYGYDLARDRFAAGIDVAPPFRLLWTFRAATLIEFPPAVAYGRLYFANNAGFFFAISARTGLRAWRQAVGRCVAASPAVERGRVYMTFLNKPPCNASSGADGLVVSFEAGTGRIDWQRTIGPTETSPLVANGLVYVGDWRGFVYAFRAKDGVLVWKTQLGGKVKGGAALSAGTLYVGSYDGNLYALSARTGKVVWRAAAQGSFLGNATFYATPAVAYGRVYVGATDGKMYSYGAASGKLRWSHGTGGYVYASAAVWHGLVLIGSYSGTFTAFDAATGDVRWTFRANGPISGSPTVIRGLVYFATLKELTYALDAATGKQVWTFPDGKYSPAVADRRRLYLVGYARVFGLLPQSAPPLRLTAAQVRADLRSAKALAGAQFLVLPSVAAAKAAARHIHGARICNVAVKLEKGRAARRAVVLLRADCAG